MKRLPGPALAIDHFPVSWADSLSQLLGPISFRLEHPTPHATGRSWLGLVSSHDSKQMPAKFDWQSALQSALLLAHRQGWGIMYAHDTPYAPVIAHMAHRMGLPTCEITISNDKRPALRAETNQSTVQLALTPGPAPNSSRLLLHDRAVVFLPERVFAIHLREHGKIAEILRQRLSASAFPRGTVYVAITAPGSDSKRSASDWMQRGAVGWIIPQPRSFEPQRSSVCRPTSSASTLVPIMKLRQWKNCGGNFLVHCTRARLGPWPDQSLMQFHDELLQQPWSHPPSVMETLERILVQQRLVATTHLKRGPVKTVCFSAQPLERLLDMRRFQSHLSRWDWEPFGIMIKRDWLVEKGARRVQYLESSTASSLSLEEQAFSQFLSTGKDDKERPHGSVQDWTHEKEWRIADDVRLNPIPFSQAAVFVPTQQEARAIANVSRWPIVITQET